MNRISKTFEQLRDKGRTALVSYVTAGDPGMDMTLPLMQELVAGGADLLEIGVAFSDPVADGSVIQLGHQRALKAGSNLKDTLKIIEQFRESNDSTPVILMSYINPIENMGYDNFITAATTSGVDGVILVDMPPEEGEALTTVMLAKGVFPIFLVAPTTKDERLKKIAACSKGFIYAVSVKGVTGTKTVDITAVEQQVHNIRRHTGLPVGVGFGIRDGESAAAVAKHADAVIVGSAFVSIIEQNMGDKEALLHKIKDFAAELRRAIDSIKVAVL